VTISFSNNILHHGVNKYDTYWIRGWVDPRAGLDVVVRRKMSSP